jgi:heterodisulfide reductase subunit C
MNWISLVAFGLLLIVGFGLFTARILQIRKNILLGRDADRSDKPAERWRLMLLVALGQKKMFQNPIPAVLHLAIYAAFVVTQIELIEIFVDGLTGNHRVFMPYLGGFYTFIISFIEILSVLAFVATIAFLARRNMLKIPRFVKSELNGWPKLDANLILIFEILLISFIMMMNGGDEVLYNRGLTHSNGLEDVSGSFGFSVSQYLGPLLFGQLSDGAVMAVERIGWWGHILMVFLFLNYLPYSKHFHVVLAFPNVYYSNLEQQGRFNNMEAVTNEVKLMLDPNADPYAVPAEGAAPPQRFGAKDVTDLSWKNLLDAYSCTECGRCTAACPANQTGKLLSPRKIMMDTRDRLEEVGKNIKNNGPEQNDGKSLLGNYITDEEIWACNTCNACVEECPVNIDPLNIIMELRRYSVMEESKMPTELTGMLTNIENNGAPWQFSQADRLKWKDEA